RLLEGEVDCALGALEGRGLACAAERRLRALPLHEEEPKIVCAPSHPLARKRAVDLRTLATLDWVLLPPETATRSAFDALFLGAGVEPPPATIESASFHTNLNLVASTRLCSFVPASTMLSVVHAGQLRELRISDATLSNRPLALYTLADTAPFAALQVFIDAVLSSVPGRAAARGSRTRS
ncbi:MAG: LysR family transcriptional regulator substrate-binding protein, partial [Burkholderiales bacterium]|nr:LysR family transcriptional regulator substrate-binding protein [Burkholderiales bacterium]